MSEEHIEKILKLREVVVSGSVTNNAYLMRALIDVLLPELYSLRAEINELKKPRAQETQPELPIWKKFPVRLATFEKSHEFCIKMHFGQGRLAGILQADGATMFDGTYNKVKSKTGSRWHYYIEPEAFLAALLTYPFRNPAERALVEQYKQSRGETQHGSGG